MYFVYIFKSTFFSNVRFLWLSVERAKYLLQALKVFSPMTAGNSFSFGVDVKASWLISQRGEAEGISSPPPTMVAELIWWWLLRRSEILTTMFAAITSYRNPHSRSPTLGQEWLSRILREVGVDQSIRWTAAQQVQNSHIGIGRNGRT